MTDRKIWVTPVRRAEVDIEKLVAGLLLLVEQMAKEESEERDQQPASATPEEPAA